MYIINNQQINKNQLLMNTLSHSNIHHAKNFDGLNLEQLSHGSLDQEISAYHDQIIPQVLGLSKSQKLQTTKKCRKWEWLQALSLIVLVLIALICFQYFYLSNHSENIPVDQGSSIQSFSVASTTPLQSSKAGSKNDENQNRKLLKNQQQTKQFRFNEEKKISEQPLKNKDLFSKNLKTIIGEDQTQFIINSQLWTFERKSSNYLEKLIHKNHQQFASLSNFKVNVLSKNNYHQYISARRVSQIQTVFQILRKRMELDSSNLKVHIDSIERRLILLSALEQNGGIIVDDLVTITENFDWIRQIKNNIYVNRGNSGVQPQVAGFYSLFYSSQSQKLRNMVQGMQQVQRYMILIPTMEDYFIAAGKKSNFIVKLLDEILAILKSPKQVIREISQKQLNYIKMDGKDLYNQYFTLACQRLLLRKQNQLDNSSKDLKNRQFAIDYYGLNLINSFYGPNKMPAFLKEVSTQKIIQNLARWDMNEYETVGGPMKYITNMIKPLQINDFLTRILTKTTHKNEKGIMEGSFVQKMYFPEGNEPFIYENLEKAFVNQTAKPWSNLPKIIWLYWDSGFANISNVPAEVFLCVQNLKGMASLSGFQVRQVNSTNLNQYLETATLEQIDSVIKNAKMHVFPQTKSDIYRLALLYKYGGVYLDAATIAVQSFDWLVDIAKLPSQLISNRYGEVPDVLMFWNPNFGGSFEWEINEAYHTKSEWRLSIFNGFMTAVKGSEFVKEWMELFQQLLMKPVQEVMKVFEDCNITKFKWTNQRNHYLLAMDTGKCVLGRRQKWVKSQSQSQWSNSMDYYKVWTINSFAGYFKLRFSLSSNTNYDNMERKGINYFLTRYSQEYTEGIIGKIHFLFKIIGQERPAIQRFMIKNLDHLLEETHPQSVFRKYVYNQKYTKFEMINERLVIKNN